MLVKMLPLPFVASCLCAAADGLLPRVSCSAPARCAGATLLGAAEALWAQYSAMFHFVIVALLAAVAVVAIVPPASEKASTDARLGLTVFAATAAKTPPAEAASAAVSVGMTADEVAFAEHVLSGYVTQTEDIGKTPEAAPCDPEVAFAKMVLEIEEARERQAALQARWRAATDGSVGWLRETVERARLVGTDLAPDELPFLQRAEAALTAREFLLRAGLLPKSALASAGGRGGRQKGSDASGGSNGKGVAVFSGFSRRRVTFASESEKIQVVHGATLVLLP